MAKPSCPSGFCLRPTHPEGGINTRGQHGRDCCGKGTGMRHAVGEWAVGGANEGTGERALGGKGNPADPEGSSSS